MNMAINNGINPFNGEQASVTTDYLYNITSIDEVKAAVAKMAHHIMRMFISSNNYAESISQSCAQQAILSISIDDCMAKGRDVVNGGAGRGKLVQLRLLRRLGLDVRPPSVLPPEMVERQNPFVRLLHGVRIEIQDDDTVQSAADRTQQDALRRDSQVDIHDAVFRPHAADHDITLRFLARMGEMLVGQRGSQLDKRMHLVRLL